MFAEEGLGTSPAVLISCEHAGNDVPDEYEELFAHARDELKSHRGYDPGALEVALRLSGLLSAPFFHTRITRLLVEPNRSLGHPDLFSRFTRLLPDDEKQRILATYYHPHRASVCQQVEMWTTRGRPVVHVGVHSFTDDWPGQDRDFEIGLLFDPARIWEAEVCTHWAEVLGAIWPEVRVRANEPYLGVDDGLTTALRDRFPGIAYAGIEVELRQGFLLSEPASDVAWALGTSLRSVLGAD
ncbi:MAG: N-formylglutamate amidohydrolase [Phycisphaerales bacterium]|nr:N-formylglutamate amidohydrolase [Phycisphaerales bacterium]